VWNGLQHPQRTTKVQVPFGGVWRLDTSKLVTVHPKAYVYSTRRKYILLVQFTGFHEKKVHFACTIYMGLTFENYELPVPYKLWLNEIKLHAAGLPPCKGVNKP
jgi:hypothetical protein